MFKRILVAVDSGPTRMSSVHSAAALARLTGARVRVLHVAAFAATLATVVPLEDDAEAQFVLDEAVDLLRRSGVETDGVIVHALTTQIPGVISETAAEWQADLLVLAPHHRDLLGALLDPRVSDAVAHTGRTSVLLVPENGRGASAASTARVAGPREIALGTEARCGSPSKQEGGRAPGTV
ncbi:universal stress protein [Streptomyces sp. NPDC007126]|uniref:universal stress protein n=1 Tax=Streptomyces sp. NPDC007126 TaxID=3364774 RepID=UPI0036CE9C33